jgi:hypothetical protein
MLWLASFAAAPVTRSISAFSCPANTQHKTPVVITLTATGMSDAYHIEERIPPSWNITTASKYYVQNRLDGYRYVIIDRYPGEYTSNYSIVIPQNYGASGAIVGTYLYPGNFPAGAPILGPGTVNVRNITCVAGTADDRDGDGYGPGCACPAPDCDDNNASIHPNANEQRGTVDFNCDGIVCDPSPFDPAYYFANPCGSGTLSERTALANNWLGGQFRLFIDKLASLVPTTYTPEPNTTHSGQG